MKYKKVNLEEIEGLIQGGGLAENSLKKRRSVLKNFRKFIVESGKQKTLEDYIDEMKLNPNNPDCEEFEQLLMEFFSAAQLKNGLKPKKQTVGSYRSNIKGHVWKETNAKVDIMNNVQFPKFTVSSFLQKYYSSTYLSSISRIILHWGLLLFSPILQSFYKGFIKELKSLGRADTRHNDAIDEVTEGKIDDLLSLLQKLMEEKDKSSQRYKNLVLCLPESHREDWHRLAQYGVMYICVKYCARRGREGIFPKFIPFQF